MSSRPRTDWHELSLNEALATLGATREGCRRRTLSPRLAVVGPNALSHDGRPASWWVVLAAQFKSVVVLLLVAGAMWRPPRTTSPTPSTGHRRVALNMGARFAVEIRAHRAIEALDRLEAHRATVLRDGILREIDARDLVPVTSSRSMPVSPSSTRVLSSTELRVVEAAADGEPVRCPSVLMRRSA